MPGIQCNQHQTQAEISRAKPATPGTLSYKAKILPLEAQYPPSHQETQDTPTTDRHPGRERNKCLTNSVRLNTSMRPITEVSQHPWQPTHFQETKKPYILLYSTLFRTRASRM